jgi:phage-related protein
MEFKVHINTTPEAKTALKRTLAAYLNPMNGVKTLIDSHDIEKTYYVKYAGNIDLTNYVNALQFTIPFKATDPIIYGSFEQVRVGSGTITNDGTLECPLTIEVVGAATNPSVVVGGKTLTYTGVLTSSDTLIIDTGALTCTLNGANALANLTGLTTDVLLAVGDTEVTVPSTGTVTFRFREQWI